MMLDLSSCQSTAASSWATASWTVFGWLTNPALILPPIVLLMIVPLLVRPLYRHRWLSGIGVFFLVGYLLIGSPIGISLGSRMLTSVLPSDSGATADAIVVLGRGSELRSERVDVAAQLWQDKRAPLVFVSGWGDAQPMMQRLQRKGLPHDAVDGEPCSRTTEENARFSAALLEPDGVHHIILVTDPPHMLRSLLTFHSYGFDVIPHISPLSDHLSRQKQGFLVFREYIGLASYGVLGRFAPRDAAQVKTVGA
ncbi:MAG: YdcF family protein [Elainellaceae cyanobacterium]